MLDARVRTTISGRKSFISGLVKNNSGIKSSLGLAKENKTQFVILFLMAAPYFLAIGLDSIIP